MKQLLICGQVAIPLKQIGIHLFPNDSNSYYIISESFLKLNKTNEAISNLKKAILINNNNYFAHNALGNIYWKNDNIDEAICCFQHVLKINPNFKDAEKMSEELSDIIRISFSEGQKLDFGNPFSNVNKAFAHVLINKDNLSCKTCFNRNIPGDFLNDMFLLLSKFKLIKSLNNQ